MYVFLDTRGGLDYFEISNWVQQNRFPIVLDFVCSSKVNDPEIMQYSKYLSVPDEQVRQ